MRVTLEKTQSELPRLINLVQQGEEVVIVSNGQAIAKITSVTPIRPAPNRRAWLDKLAALREATVTGTPKTSPTTEEMLEDLRSDRVS